MHQIVTGRRKSGGDSSGGGEGLPRGEDEPDEALVQRVLAGDTEAYAVLVGRYRDRFARYALHMLGTREDAEEALQDAFIRAYRALARCEKPAQFETWLFTIVANRCRTHRSRRTRRERTFVADEGQATPGHDDRTLDRMAWSEAVEQALGKLDVDQREAFLLKYVEELSYEEMAALTGVGVSALKMRVKRAAARLRALLEDASDG